MSVELLLEKDDRKDRCEDDDRRSQHLCDTCSNESKGNILKASFHHVEESWNYEKRWVQLLL